MNKKRTHYLNMGWFVLVAVFLSFWGCAHNHPLPNESYHLVYNSNGLEENGAGTWSPAFVVYGHAKTHNRIGRPTAVRDEKEREKIFIDAEDPVAYYMKRSFKTDKATYTNHIYRVHFPGTPYSLVPFNLTAGKNVGLMVIVTLNSENLPVLVTTVHTCGCYKAIVPTQYLPESSLPKNWTGHRLRVYGENLPSQLNIHSVSSPRIMVHLRPGVHRVMDLEVQDQQVLSSRRYQVVQMDIEPMDNLTALPVKNGTTSLYHSEGILKGHVKGSVKPLETMFMSLISLDMFVGTDKAYADPAETGNPFYTSLKPWRREDSNMWYFAKFLAYWGWRL